MGSERVSNPWTKHPDSGSRRHRPLLFNLTHCTATFCALVSCVAPVDPLNPNRPDQRRDKATRGISRMKRPSDLFESNALTAPKE